MRFSTAVAAGARSVTSLRELCAKELANGRINVQSHDDCVVAWTATCPWIDTSDDGEVLAVLDGRLHDLSPPAGQAKVVLERYRAEGVKVAGGLLGDFVLIILDRRSGTLLVARDPVGVRPWYQGSTGGLHVGASDLGMVASLPWVNTAVNERIAVEYLAAVTESRGETLYAGIGTLGPGCTWYRHGSRPRTFAHHRWDFEPDLETPWEDAVERCRTVFDEVVMARLAVSGSATSQLSGGLDSSAVVGTIAMLDPTDLLVGRLVFDGPRADERAFSDAVIDHWKVPAVSVPPWVPSEDETAEVVQQVRRPAPDPHFTMFASLDRALLDEGRADGLTGLGGDDAFVAAGIGPRMVSAIQLRQRAVLASVARWVALNPGRTWPELVRPTLGHLAAPWRRRRSPSWIPSAVSDRFELRRLLNRHPERVTGIHAIDGRIANLTSGYDASILETRAVMGDLVGRRESHPFLDPRFIQATYGLDPWWPTRGGHDRALQLAAFGDRLPAAVARRRSKAEFSEIFWPQLLDERCLARVRTGPLWRLGWLDEGGFAALVANAKEGKANAAIPLSRCASLDHWMRTQ